MNMLMDNRPHAASPQRGSPPQQHAELRISTTPPNGGRSPHMMSQQHITNNNNNNNNNNTNNNNNNEIQISAATNLTSGVKSTLKRSFDVAFLMMPDERIKQKQQAEKHARLSEAFERHQQLQQQQQQQQQQQTQYPTDLSPRAQQLTVGALPLSPQSQTPPEHFNLIEARRYTQLALRSPRIYDDPTVVIPIIDVCESPLKSAFTKVTSSSSASASSSSSSRLESPVESSAPPLSPDQLSCHSMSPPVVATPPPRTNSGGSGNGSAPNGLTPPLPPNPIIYHNFRPEYQFNGAFQSVNQMQALQAQARIKQQLLYRAPNGNIMTNPSVPMPPNGPPPPPPEFLHAYPGFPFPQAGAGGAPHPFAVAAAQPELPRIVQNPAAAAILSTLIPPTLASTFSLTAQNVCAKCNISFRMTSDLVYHMRSHHKSEVAFDPNRRKREEKLRCPVCQETFRERHHLTRHMTAHQDKESDHPVSASPTSASSSSASSSSSSSSSSSTANASSLDCDNEIINVVSGGNGPRHHQRLSGMGK